MSLSGKIAIITGGSKGIGKATALKLRSQGATIVVNYAHDIAAAEKAVADLGGSKFAFAVQADIGKQADCQKLVDVTVEKFGKIDILVNNAGFFGILPITAVTEEFLDNMFKIDVYGLVYMMKFATPYMAPGSSIINISASAATPGAVYGSDIGFGFYTAAKGAIEQLSRSAAREFGESGISVNIVSPGPVLSDGFLAGGIPEQRINAMKSATVRQRIGECEDIANVVAFLASKEAEWIVGANIKANGGLII